MPFSRVASSGLVVLQVREQVDDFGSDRDIKPRERFIQNDQARARNDGDPKAMRKGRLKVHGGR